MFTISHGKIPEIWWLNHVKSPYQIYSDGQSPNFPWLSWLNHMKPSIFHGEIPDFPLYKPSESWVKSLSPGHPIALQDPHPFILLCDTDLPRLRVTVATTKQATDVELSINIYMDMMGIWGDMDSYSYMWVMYINIYNYISIWIYDGSKVLVGWTSICWWESMGVQQTGKSIFMTHLWLQIFVNQLIYMNMVIDWFTTIYIWRFP